MNEIQDFNFNGLQVRTLLIDDEPWFIAKDVANILGYDQTSNMLKRIDNEDFISSKLDGMNMKSVLINESGLYTAIFGSKKKEAESFTRWVTRDILPSIRKTGVYQTSQSISETDIDVLKLKSKYFDEYVEHQALINSCYSFTDATSEIGLKYGELTKLLIQYGFVHYVANSKIEPYSKYDNDLFFIKKFNKSKNKELSQTMITPKGLETFRELFGNKSQLTLFN